MRCCQRECNITGGHYTCFQCGKVLGMALLLNNVAFSTFESRRYHSRRLSYSRVRRCRQIVDRLTGSGPLIKPEIIEFVIKSKPTDIHSVFARLRDYPVKGPKPFTQASSLLYYSTKKKADRPIVLTHMQKQRLVVASN